MSSKKRKQTSDVWNHFDVIEEQKKDAAGKGMVDQHGKPVMESHYQCNEKNETGGVCGRKFKMSSSTSTLKYHLNTHDKQ